MKLHSGPKLASRKAKKVTGDEFLAVVIDCQSCGYPHLDPLPTIEELGAFYAYHFYEKQKPDYIEKMESEEHYWLSLYKLKLEIFLSQTKVKQPKILDVGSSGGFFLKAAKDLGAEVYGIEPSEKAANYCAKRFGIEEVQVCIYENADFQDEHFDIIHSSMVIEHLLNPKHFVEWAKLKLKKGGLFICEIPNEFNKFQKIATEHLKHEDWFVAYPDHLNYFNEAYLRSLMTEYNFNFLESIASYPMEQFILSGVDYLANPALGREAHKGRMMFELNLIESGQSELLKNYYKFWASQGIGRTTVCLFKKN